ncbi:MAG TPA: molecular chaperone Hsp33 [Rhodospirillaceae bacterium]|nr:molecular chaperone Hsp33 [Candidatus Neomarinimicrobiota bacterium]HCX14915.1 molecular chaperone Hsp33 [Rhodospirillaceae bacterium]
MSAVYGTASDICLPFLINEGAFRGRLVRLTKSADAILTRHNYPKPISNLLAESMVAAVALASGLKYKGVFTFQIQGRGPVRALVVDITSDGALRGCVKFDESEFAEEVSRPRLEGGHPRLLGRDGYLAFTVDQGPDSERYQGIVDLAGESISDTVHHYFRQSEQLDSALKIVVTPPLDSDDSWCAAGLIIQRMPEDGDAQYYDAEEMEDAWRTAVIMLASLTDAELLDTKLSPLRLLRRLYGTVGVRVTAAKPLAAVCRCSRRRSESIIASFPVQEMKALAIDGMVSMTCEFCRAVYLFKESEIDNLTAKQRQEEKSVLS